MNCPFTPRRWLTPLRKKLQEKEKKEKKAVFYLEPEPGQSEREQTSPPFSDVPGGWWALEWELTIPPQSCVSLGKLLTFSVPPNLDFISILE